jgi:hypothetical protein
MRSEIERWRQLSVGTDGVINNANVEGLLAQIK